jgi:hypothetical protein
MGGHRLSSVPVVKTARETQAALAKPVVRNMLTEAGDDEKQINAALSALDTAAAEKPEPPPSPFEPKGEEDDAE